MATEVDASFLNKLKTNKERKEHLETIELWNKGKYETAKEDCTKLIRAIRKDFSAMCSVLY